MPVGSNRTSLHPMWGSLQTPGPQRPDLAGEDPEAGRPAVLIGVLERELHPEADAQQRDPGGDPLAEQLVGARAR